MQNSVVKSNMAQSSVIQLQALGGLCLTSTTFNRPKLLLLLSYLALEGTQQRNHLAELFWQENNRMKNLSMAFTLLRQRAGNVVAVDAKQASILISSDVGALLESLDKSDWERAATLYTGAFLEGVVLDDWSSELEEWVYTTREYLAERVQYALLNLAEDAAKQQNFDSVRELAERAYKLPGLGATELTNLKRLYPLLCAGRSLLAPEVRKEAEEYGLSLELSTEEARATFKQDKAIHTLPMHGTSFVGRDVELTELATLLSRRDVSLVTLLGTAGVGKTRLALQLAHHQQQLNTFKDGFYFVSFEAADDITSTLLSSLGINQGGNVEPVQQLIDYFASKELLLVLDNFEHLAEGATLLSQVLRNCPNLKVLVTSRETLKLTEEHVFALEGLPFPSVTDARVSYPDDDKSSDAVQLFRERAQQVKAQFELNGQLADVLRICGLVEGLPLGIELAASWVRVMSCADIADEIEKGLEFLTTITLNVPERHRSLKAAFDYSWRLLTQKEQEVLRKLSVFVGGFRRDAASEVAGATISLLASLVDKSLLRVSPTGRYDQHPLLHQFAGEKLEEHATEQTQTREKHGVHYFHFLKSVEEAVKGPTQKEVLGAIEEELENIRAAWYWALRVGRLEELQPSSQVLHVFFDIRKRLREGVVLFSEALTRMRDDGSVQSAVLGAVSTAQAWLLYQLGQYDEAAKLAWQGLDFVKDDQPKMQGLNLNTLASIAWRMGNHREAKQHWEQALMLAKTQGRDKEVASYLGNLALAETTLGDYEVAVRHLKEALTLSREHKNYHDVAHNLIRLGNLYLNMGELQTAKTYWEDGFELAKDRDLPDTIPFFLINLGVVAYELGNYSQAKILSKEALHKFRENEDAFLEAFVLAKLGKITTALEEYALARDYFRQAINVAQEIKGASVLIEVVIGLAELCAKQDNAGQAASLFSLVLHHTATVQADKDHAQQQLTTLQHQLSFEDIEEAIERGKTITLEGVVAEFIGQDSSRSSPILNP